jgi:hypothetical protein
VQIQQLSSLPVGATRASSGLAVAVSLSEAARALAHRGLAAQLTMLHHRLADPVDLGVATDGLVGRIGQHDLEELVARVLANPVGVEHSQSTAAATDTLLFNKKFTKLTSL